jgi:hypothetical protein
MSDQQGENKPKEEKVGDQINIKVKDQARDGAARVRCAPRAAAQRGARRETRAAALASHALAAPLTRARRPQDNAEVHFKVRPSTKFEKARRRRRGAGWRASARVALADGPVVFLCLCAQIFDAYCSKKSLSREHVRFLFDGQRINGTTTPLDVRRAARNRKQDPILAHSATALTRRLLTRAPAHADVAAGDGGRRQH